METELKVWRQTDGKWRREMETLGDKFKGLQVHDSKKLAMIEKLKEDINHLQHEIYKRDERVKYLEVEIEVERSENAMAFERARLARQEVESLRIQLKEEVDAHELRKKEVDRAALEAERQRESSLAEVRALQGHIAYLKSDAHRVEVVENYRSSTLGKVEVALACKGSFDSLLAQLPRQL